MVKVRAEGRGVLTELMRVLQAAVVALSRYAANRDACVDVTASAPSSARSTARDLRDRRDLGSCRPLVRFGVGTLLVALKGVQDFLRRNVLF